MKEPPLARLPRRYRFLLTVASCFVPRPARAEWHRSHERELWHWRVFLSERGELSPESEAQLLRYCWHAAGEAVEQSLHPARVLRSAGFCLTAMAAVLAAVALWTGFFRAARSAWRPLPYLHAGRVVTVSSTGFFPDQRRPVPSGQFTLWQRRGESFEAVAPYIWDSAAREAFVGADFFAVLGVRAALGRTFSPRDNTGAVITHTFWKARYAQDRAVIGRQVLVGGKLVPIIGVLAPDFRFIRRDTEVWRLLNPAALPARVGVVARLRPGVTPKQARGELGLLSARHLQASERVSPYVTGLAQRLHDSVSFFRTGFFVFLAAGLAAAAARRMLLASTTRFELFFALKILMLDLLLTAAFTEWAASVPLSLSGWGPSYEPFIGVFYSVACIFATLWCFHDQRRRCRQCLLHLSMSMPVTFGSHGSWLLDPAGTELFCDRGHGTLYVPENHASTQKAEGWTALDESWRDLFDPAERR